MLPLIIAPAPILRRQATAVSLPVTPELRQLAEQMFVAMEHYKGIGLAAPQVDQSVQLMVISTPERPTAFINPQVLKSSWKKDDYEEGCLSLPGLYGLVRRPTKVLARYVTLNGETKEEWLDGLLARVYQHEVDHLNGVLFIDRTENFTAGQELLEKYAAQ